MTATGYSIEGVIITSGVPTDVGICPITTSYNFYDPNGGSHELGLQAIGAIYDTQFTEYGTFTCNPEGNPQGTNILPEMQNIGAFQTGGDDEVSTVMDNDCVGNTVTNDCVNGSPALTVVDVNGTQYLFPASEVAVAAPGQIPAASSIVYPTMIEDRNGNVIHLSGFPGVSQATVEDTLGNPLISINNSNGQISSYTVGGVSYTLQYTTLSNIGYSLSNWQVPATIYGVACGAQFSVQNASYSVVQSITLPNGQQYNFQYDPVYGRVSRITYPDGGWVAYQWGPSDTYSTDAMFSGTKSGSPMTDACNFQYQTPVITQRTVGYSATSGAVQTQSFHYYTTWTATPSNGSSSYLWTNKQTLITTTDNVTGNSFETVYNYTPILQPPNPPAYGYEPPQLPVESAVAYYDWGHTATAPTLPSGSPIETVSKAWADQFEMASETTTVSNLPSSANTYGTTYCYNAACAGPGGFPEVVYNRAKYDFGPAPTGTLARSEAYSYYRIAVPCLWGPSNCQSWINTYAGTGPNQIAVTNGGGALIAKTTATYDGQAITPASTPSGTHDETNYAAGSSTARGNVTQVVRWSNVGISPTTTYTYYETGQVYSMTDPCGNSPCTEVKGSSHTTYYSYKDADGSACAGCAANPAGNSNAYLTKITNPLGQTQQFGYSYITNSTYMAGELGSAEDENGQLTTYTYADLLYRLTQSNYPDGGETTISYNDSVPSVTTTVYQTPNPSKTTVSVLDGMGHTIQSQLTTDPYGADNVDIAYDGEGQVYKKTNPFRGSTPPAGTTTTFYYDAVGRPIETSEQDGNLLQWCYNGVLSIPAVSSGVCNNSVVGVSSRAPGSVTGTWVDSTDEVGNHWQRSSDAFGRLTQVMEPNGTSKAPSMETDYSYDALSDLSSVIQWGGPNGSSGVRTRSFTYDSLSRLIQSFNPESDWICYGTSSGGAPNGNNCTTGYDANGNLASKTDARGIQTSYSYDSLNRLISKTYSDTSTPWACYLYDSATNGVGSLASEWTQLPSIGSCPASPPGSGSYLTEKLIANYDQMGRLWSETQCTPSGCRGANPCQSSSNAYQTYTYDLAGNLICYGNGIPSTPGAGSNPVAFTQSFDGAGRLATLTTNMNTPSETLFAAQGYAAFGGLTSATYGSSGSSSNAVTLTRTYDPRLRISSEIDLGNSPGVATSGGATITITGAEQSK